MILAIITVPWRRPGSTGPASPLTGYGTMDGPLNVTIIGNGCRAGT
jgi:hypothetical protein